MITPPADPRATARPAGLTDTIWAGFDLVHRHFWLLILPIAVDILMWLGPQLSVAPIVDGWSTSAAAPAVADDVLARSMDEARGELLRSGDALKRYNLLSLLALPVLGLGIPSSRAGLSGIGPVLPIQSESWASLTIIGTVMLGLVLAAVYYGLLGHLVREGVLRAREFARDLPTVLSALFTLFGLLIVVGMAVGVPMGALLTAMQAASPALASLIGPMIIGVLLWAMVYLFFTIDALYVSQVWPASAVQNSVRVVRHNFWSTLGFIAVFLLIFSGFPLVWDRLATTQGAPGVMVGIVGHSYISSALAAASMTYYKERFERMIASHEGSNAPVAPVRS